MTDDVSVGDTLIRDGEEWSVESIEDGLVDVSNGDETDSWSLNFIEWSENVRKKPKARP